ncbi:MAG: methyltransferase domain-containing protein [Patescibacteria group bacterium]|nr:methyltransferase domain-containing protein [Patescibacteria group bacterium]
MDDRTTNVAAGDLNYDSYESEIYDDDIRRSIPGHDELHKKFEEVAREYIASNKVERILELGIGTGLTSEKILKLIPTASLTAVDFSEKMMDGAKKRLSKYNVAYILGDYAEINLDDDFDMVISVIGIHHQKDEGKKKLFRKIYGSLKSGGVFIFGDLVTYKAKTKAAINDAQHFHHLVEHARNEPSLKEWAYHHKFLNLLAPIEDQIDWLKEAGFSEISVAYEHLNTALIIAKK